MSDAQHQQFTTRVKRISRRHDRLSKGYVAAVTRDGLVVAKPRPFRLSLPWRSALILLAAAIFLKAALLSQVGAADYNARVERLALGTELEQAAAWVMTADPATVWVADMLSAMALPDDAE